MKLPPIEDFEHQSKNEIWHEAAEIICQKHAVSLTQMRRAAGSEHIVFLTDDKFVVKIYNPHRNGFAREKTALETARTSLKIPEIVAFGGIDDYKYMVTTQLEGEQMTRDNWLKLASREQIQILSGLAEGLRELHTSDASKIDFDWQKFIWHQAETCFERQRRCGVNRRILAQIPRYLEENLKLLPTAPEPVFLHGDVHFGNLRLLKRRGKWKISGLFDFADSLKGAPEYDLLAVGVLMIQGQGNLQREFFRAFGYPDSEIGESLRKRLMLLTRCYECSDLRRYAVRLRPEAVRYSLTKLEKAIWNFC